MVILKSGPWWGIKRICNSVAAAPIKLQLVPQSVHIWLVVLSYSAFTWLPTWRWDISPSQISASGTARSMWFLAKTALNSEPSFCAICFTSSNKTDNITWCTVVSRLPVGILQPTVTKGEFSFWGMNDYVCFYGLNFLQPNQKYHTTKRNKLDVSACSRTYGWTILK